MEVQRSFPRQSPTLLVSNLSLLMREGSDDIYHYPLKESING